MSDTDSDDATAQGDDQPTGEARGDETPGDDPGRSRASGVRSADGGVTAEGDRDSVDGRNIVGYVQWAAFAILCLLALVATFRFYFAASEAIRVWFSPDFVPVFQAVFNLVVLAASAIGISVLVRRIA